MKRFSIYSIVGTIILPLLLPACKVNDPKVEDIFYAEDIATIQQLTQDGKLYTIQEFKDSFMTEEGNYLSEQTLYRDRATGSGTNGKYLFSLDTLPANGPGIYIMGRVTTDDYGGNFYKSLVIQQVTDQDGNRIPQQALRISVDAGSVSGLYPRGQMILIRCNGLAVGRYANQPQLCVPSYNNNVFADKASQKIGWAPGRIPLARFKHATQYIGQPNEKKLWYDTCTIAELTASYSDLLATRNVDGKLIYVDGIHYTGQCLSEQKQLMYCTTNDPAVSPKGKTANVFAPTTGNVGYPQSRVIFDEEDENFICVSMSEYAKQANYYLPGATSGTDGGQYVYDSTIVIDYSKPYLIANLPDKGECYIPVEARKEHQGWKEDDVIYGDNDHTSENAYIYNGQVWKKEMMGVIHCPEYRGSVKGILSYYMDNANYDPQATNWAISICDLSDLNLKKDGEAWVPLEYTPN